MSNETAIHHSTSRNREKGVYYPFDEASMQLLDKLIEEHRKEMYKENNDKARSKDA